MNNSIGYLFKIRRGELNKIIVKFHLTNVEIVNKSSSGGKKHVLKAPTYYLLSVWGNVLATINTSEENGKFVPVEEC